MKKNILSLMALFTIMSASAENSLQVVPFLATAGADTYAFIEMNNENPVAKMSFDLYMPTGFRVYTNNKGNLVSSSFALDNTDGRVAYYDEDEEDDVTAFDGASGSNFMTDSEGVEFFRYGGVGEYPVAGNSGKLFKIRIKVDASVAPGVYPIYMKNVTFLDTESVGPHDMEFASYIVVGEPSTANVALKGAIPSFVNVPLATETAVKTLDLTEVTASYGDFTYVAGRDVVRPTADVTANVKYVAPLAGTYSSFCAPVDVTTPCYKLTSCDGTTAVFTESSVAPADEPVLIKQAVNSAAASVTLTAVTKQTGIEGYYVAPNGSELHKGTNATIPALRGYWPLGGGSNLRIAIETPTGIEYIGTADEVFGNTYDLQGRQVQNAKNGVFVVNGKKQFVK